MSITKATLVRRVLEEHAIIGIGESIPNEDNTFVGNKVDTAHAELEAAGVAYWETSAIPDDVIEGLTRYVGAMIAFPYGVLPRQEADLEKVRARAMLDKATARPSQGKTVKAVYY